jgi:hypothetical protein
VIERREFFFLYANLSGLPDLAFWHLASQLLVTPSEEPKPVETTEQHEEQDTIVLTDFDDLDFSALDEVEINTSVPLETPALEQRAVEQPEEYDDLPDIERLLTRAYASEESLRERLDACYEKADLAALKAGLGELPSQMPPLTQQLSADEMKRWVERYADGDLALTELTAEIRRSTAEPLPAVETDRSSSSYTT